MLGANPRRKAMAPSNDPPNLSQRVSTPPITPPDQREAWTTVTRKSRSAKPDKANTIDTSIAVRPATSSEGPPQRPNQTGQRQRPGFTPFVHTNTFKRSRWPNNTFVPGIIIQAPLYTKYFEAADEVTSPTVDFFNDPNGNKVCYKDRFMVVVHAFDDSYVAVPAFSYAGRGIQHMAAAKKAEHLDLHDHRHINNAATRARQNNNPPLVTEQMQHWQVRLASKTAVHFTYPVSMSYRNKVGLLGQLTQESTKTLIRHYYQHVLGALQRAGIQQ